MEESQEGLNKGGGLKEDTLVAFGHEGDKMESS